MWDMGLDPSSTLVIGAGFGIVPGPVRPVDPKKEYLASGPGRFMPAMPQVINRTIDDLTKWYGFKHIMAALTDPAVQSSYRSLKYGIFDGDVNLTPAVKVAASKARESKGPAEVGVKPTNKPTPDEQAALDMVAFGEWLLGRKDCLHASWLQLADAMAYGCKLGEVVAEVAEGGGYAGKLALDAIKVKPYWAWQFVVDRFWAVKGILAYDASKGGFVVLPPDHCLWHSWMPEDGDPRGKSILRPAYVAWNFKVQGMPEAYEFMKRWGQPGVDYEMAEGDDTPRIPTDENGVPLVGRDPIAAEAWHLEQLRSYRGGAAFVHPFGSKLNINEPSGDGEAFTKLFDWCDRQIVLGIEGATRGRLEAQNGSKADSETSQDESGLVKSEAKKSMAAVIRRLLRRFIAWNYGPDMAERFTPLVTLGKAEQQDKASLWGAAASLTTSGYLGESQKPELDAELGLPARDAEADAKAEAEKAKAAAELKPPAGPMGKPFPGGNPKQPAPAKKEGK